MITTLGKFRWVICALLFFATTINYLDRQVLSLLKPLLEEKFGWNNNDYANIAAVFQFSYALSMLFAGRLVDRLGTRRGFAIAIIIWSIAAMLHAVAIEIGGTINAVSIGVGLGILPVSIIGFMFCRAMLGFGESGNFPAAIKTVAEYFPKKERSFATGIFNSGANVGAVLAPLTVPWMALHWGWQSAFLLIGAAGFIWLVFWLMYYQIPAKQTRLSKEEKLFIEQDLQPAAAAAEDSKPAIPFLQLFRYKQTWAFTIGKFLTDGVWWFFLFWLPAYLKDQYNMTGISIMFPLAILYSVTMIGSIGGGWFPMYFMKRGLTPLAARLKAMLIIALFPLAVLGAQPLGAISFWIPVLLIGIGAAAHQAWSANIFTTVSDLFPKNSIASVIGIGGMAGGLGGVLITKTGGRLFDFYKAAGHITTGYTIMFAICACAYLLAWVIMNLLLRNFKQ
jgi:MFS transporter, ACS family, hexuronate transporter